MKRLLFVFFLFARFAAAQEVSIIPQPASLQLKDGSFTISKKTVIAIHDEEDRKAADFFNAYLQEYYGFALPTSTKQQKKNYIHLTTQMKGEAAAKDAYTFKVAKEGVNIEGSTPAGTFYGIQTLIQLLPVQKSNSLAIPSVAIADSARFGYRGMHLDVGRHFFPVEFIKKYIDYLAMHKMNIFHWHLTEDQGWRIEIKKYPKLTEVGAWRDGTLIGHGGNKPFRFDNQRYGGFYTQEEIREIVKYAQDRYITVVPEIEMPGHSLAALAAYPEISCTGGPFEVEKRWGVFEDVYCAGNEKTFIFLENVLTEVMDLFPSPIIHIGGDESPKSRWKTCAKCQARIKAEGLEDEHELQSYFIQRMEIFLNEHGRKIIGWDEILEGGLAPNAAVMSWRGMEGGIAAANQKHNVVMTPGSHVYFDHYQGIPEQEPLAIGGYTPLSKVYSFEPTPAELSEEGKKFILGAQGNVWTEYIPTTDQVEYMIMPRMSALSEVLWIPAAQKDWEGFKVRMQQQYKRFDAMGINYAKSAFNVQQQVNVDTLKRLAVVEFLTDAAGAEIYYTLDGTEPSPAASAYSAPFTLKESAVIKAGSFIDDKLVGKVSTRSVNLHKAFASQVTFTKQPHQRYVGSGAATLVNGIPGSNRFTDGQWLGFLGDDLGAVIDLKEVMPINRISTSFLQDAENYIFLPAGVDYAISEDGKTYKKVDLQASPAEEGSGSFRKVITAEMPATKARFIKITAKNVNAFPRESRDKKRKTWLFVDEVVVE